MPRNKVRKYIPRDTGARIENGCLQCSCKRITDLLHKHADAADFLLDDFAHLVTDIAEYARWVQRPRRVNIVTMEPIEPVPNWSDIERRLTRAISEYEYMRAEVRGALARG